MRYVRMQGIVIMNLGLVNVANADENPVFRHVILCRRIHRRKKNGKWKVKVCFHAIVTDLDMTPQAIYTPQIQTTVDTFARCIRKYHRRSPGGKSSTPPDTQVFMALKLVLFS